MIAAKSSSASVLAFAGLAITGCTQFDAPAGASVEQAWTLAHVASANTPGAGTTTGSSPGDTAHMVRRLSGQPSDASDTIATVDGHAISRDRLVNLLLAGHGPGILEQLIVLTAAQKKVEQRGLHVSKPDIDREYDRALASLVGASQVDDDPTDNEPPFDRRQAEALLDDILSRRNISRAEYMLGITRNAHLRALVSADMKITDDQLRAEYDRSVGPTVQIRCIQLASLSDASRIQQALGHGERFADLAERYSVNPETSRHGGLLPPFTAQNDAVPAVIRTMAFQMQPGSVSNPVRVDNGYQMIKLESRSGGDDSSFDLMRNQIEQRLRRRLTEPAMQALYQELFDQADVQIVDPVLRDAFREKHPDRGSSRAAAEQSR